MKRRVLEFSIVLAVVALLVAWQQRTTPTTPVSRQVLSISGVSVGMSQQELSEAWGVQVGQRVFLILCQTCRATVCEDTKAHQPTTVLLDEGQVVAVVGDHLNVDSKKLSKDDSIHTVSMTVEGLRKPYPATPYESEKMVYPALGLIIRTKDGKFMEAELREPQK